jgi:asparagine synthase (glutamine-hydrolysing)
MCGIAGILWLDGARRAATHDLVPMLDAIAHRGPDDEGVWLDGPLALGQRRLSILDLSAAGHQPMVAADERHTIVVNGEIYNFVELRAELVRFGVVFRSHSDTEVLLAAYRQWGAACVERFVGMWACAIWDVREQKLWLSRDRFGIKPLYFLHRPDVFAFGSELKALLAAFPDERQANLPYLHWFLPSGALDDGAETSFRNLRALPPATNLTIDRAGRVATESWWRPDAAACRERWIGDREPVGAFAELLDSAVDLHLRADVPIGTCLSGGLDSSTLVALAARKVERPIHTYSGLYGDADCNEQQWVDAVNAHVRTTPVPIRPEPDGDLLEDLQRITWHQDEPTAGPGLYTQYHVMRRAAADVKVLLDGQGGDELLAGYLPYLLTRIDDLCGAGAGGKLRAAGLAMAMGWHWGRTWFAQAHGRLRAHMWLPPLPRGRAARAVEPPFFHPGLAGRVAGSEIVRQEPEWRGSKLQRQLYGHLRQSSIPALLHYEDRNSMAFSIEARVPYLDHRVVEFCLGLDDAFKIRGSWTKWILRKVADRHLPRAVTWRRSKLGYPTPFARWLRQGRDRDAIRDLLFSRRFLERDLVARESLEFYWDQHQRGEADRSWLLWRYVTLELWHRSFLDAFEPHPAPNARVRRRAVSGTQA